MLQRFYIQATSAKITSRIKTNLNKSKEINAKQRNAETLNAGPVTGGESRYKFTGPPPKKFFSTIAKINKGLRGPPKTII